MSTPPRFRLEDYESHDLSGIEECSESGFSETRAISISDTFSSSSEIPSLLDLDPPTEENVSCQSPPQHGTSGRPTISPSLSSSSLDTVRNVSNTSEYTTRGFVGLGDLVGGESASGDYTENPQCQAPHSQRNSISSWVEVGSEIGSGEGAGAPKPVYKRRNLSMASLLSALPSRKLSVPTTPAPQTANGTQQQARNSVLQQWLHSARNVSRSKSRNLPNMPHDRGSTGSIGYESVTQHTDPVIIRTEYPSGTHFTEVRSWFVPRSHESGPPVLPEICFDAGSEENGQDDPAERAE